LPTAVRYMADRAVVMYLGQVKEGGTTAKVLPHHATLHRGAAVGDTGADPTVQRRRIVPKGEIPSALSPPRGCPFHTRCHRKIGPRGETEKPADQRLSEGSHRIVCHIPADELAQTGAIFTSAPS
jgi:peptide/nickel transport system ATP-binding protein